jgi:murein DD-endopeptidase MepM/ murein hydrolase activator NlpD
VSEAIQVHNLTRAPGEVRIGEDGYVPAGTSMAFYPPACIHNPREKQLAPVYQFFTSLVEDPYSFITGDWCERGTGGGTPHYGIDVAAALGTRIRSPINGTVYLFDSKSTGRTVGVVSEGTVLFFCHMDKRFYRNGAQVRKGDVVGTVGMTGITTGPHVHIAYGIRSLDRDGITFGSSHYKVTDPKLFFYREQFMNAGNRKS